MRSWPSAPTATRSRNTSAPTPRPWAGCIGLGSALVRALSLEGLEFLGVKLDGFKNRMAIAGMDISMEDAPVRVFTVHTDEEIVVARKAAALLQKQA